MTDLGAWRRALVRAGQAGASSVMFEARRSTDGGSRSYRLTSFDSAGGRIGDSRDYDLLKAVMTPLERLAESIGGDTRVVLDVTTSAVRFEPPLDKGV